jgi:hypothetical protein
MKSSAAILFTVALIVLIGLGTVQNAESHTKSGTAEAAVHTFFDHVRARDWDAAYAMVNPGDGVSKESFVRDIAGSSGSLKTISSIQKVETKTLSDSSSEANVRADLQWSTAVGALRETRDFKLTKSGGDWKLDWASPQQVQQSADAKPIQTNYLRWDVVSSGASSNEWGVANAEPPRTRIISMNAVDYNGSVVIMGEVVNEDTVPGFVTINADLIGQDGNSIAQESSFDKISHTLLPKEVSPFRIDFPGRKLAEVKSVRISPTNLLVPASADPVVGVFDQHIEKDATGKAVLRGQLTNQSGLVVNIPHVLATFYDKSGKVIWVSDGYLDQALKPNQQVPFAVDVRDDIANQVQNYRVTVNYYNSSRS